MYIYILEEKRYGETLETGKINNITADIINGFITCNAKTKISKERM